MQALAGLEWGHGAAAHTDHGISYRAHRAQWRTDPQLHQPARLERRTLRLAALPLVGRVSTALRTLSRCLYLRARDGVLPWAAPLLLTVFSIGVCLCGFFPYSPTTPGAAFPTQVHRLAINVAAAALVPSPLFFWLSTRHDERWRALAWFHSLVVAIGCLCAILQILVLRRYLHVGGLVDDRSSLSTASGRLPWAG